MYDKFADTFARSRQHMKWLEIDEIIASIQDNFEDKEKIRILDVGCGSGRFLQTLIGAFPEKEIIYTGIDASQKMLDSFDTAPLPSTFDVQTQCLDMTKMSFASGSFDVIVFIASFHHLESISDRTSVLHVAADILDQKGMLYMTNWYLLSPENKKRYQDSVEKHYEDGSADFTIKIGKHSRFYHSFTVDSLDDLFKKTPMYIKKNELSQTGRNIYTIAKK